MTEIEMYEGLQQTLGQLTEILSLLVGVIVGAIAGKLLFDQVTKW